MLPIHVTPRTHHHQPTSLHTPLRGAANSLLCPPPLTQVLGLEALGVHAAALTSLTDKDAAASISKQVGKRGGGACPPPGPRSTATACPHTPVPPAGCPLARIPAHGCQVEDPSSGLRLLYVTPEKVVNSKRFFAKVGAAFRRPAAAPPPAAAAAADDSLGAVGALVRLVPMAPFLSFCPALPAVYARLLPPLPPPGASRRNSWKRCTSRGGWSGWPSTRRTAAAAGGTTFARTTRSW